MSVCDCSHYNPANPSHEPWCLKLNQDDDTARRLHSAGQNAQLDAFVCGMTLMKHGAYPSVDLITELVAWKRGPDTKGEQ